MSQPIQRRDFLQGAAIAGAGFWIANSYEPALSQAANERINIACIGCGGMGSGHVNRAARENLVALCDVDEVRAARAFEQYPNARKYRDFRRMLEEMNRQIDAVYVATPDHIHAPASVMAMRLGKHVYCEKPLAHSIHECRVMAETAARMKVATQMGNQGHASGGHRRLVEIIRSGAIGPIREAHAWCPKNFSARTRPRETPPVPRTLEWDLWLGPAPERPYHSTYLPFNWRSWWDFGTGGLGDMACHVIDPIFWSLELNYPATVEADGDPRENPEGFQTHLTVKYEFARRGDALHQQAVNVFWHHGDHVPQKRAIPGVQLPADLRLPGEGVIFIGEKGIIVGDRGPGVIAMLPRDQFANYQAPAPTLPRSPGHAEEWLAAIRGGPQPLSNFGYAAMLSETVLLGNVAWKVGRKLEWDGRAGRATNCREADAIIRREYRRGWTL
jgi:predicted dehydrogenase